MQHCAHLCKHESDSSDEVVHHVAVPPLASYYCPSLYIIIMAPDLTGAQPSTQAIFALDIVTSATALVLLGLATRPALRRIKARKFSVRSKDTGSPLKTTLGTYLFLYPALCCLFLAYLFRFVIDLLKTSGEGVDYGGNLGLHGRRPALDGSGYDYSIAVLSFAAMMASIFYSTLLNGGVWIYSNHVTSNGSNLSRPDWKSKLWNSFIMLCILGTGLAAWGLAIASRGHADSYSSVVHSDNATMIVHIVYRAVVVAASLSVSVEMLRRYVFIRKHSSKSVRPLSPHSNTTTYMYNTGLHRTDQRTSTPCSLRPRRRPADLAEERLRHLRHRAHLLRLCELEPDDTAGEFIPPYDIWADCGCHDPRHGPIRSLDEWKDC